MSTNLRKLNRMLEGSMKPHYLFPSLTRTNFTLMRNSRISRLGKMMHEAGRGMDYYTRETLYGIERRIQEAQESLNKVEKLVASLRHSANTGENVEVSVRKLKDSVGKSRDTISRIMDDVCNHTYDLYDMNGMLYVDKTYFKLL